MNYKALAKAVFIVLFCMIAIGGFLALVAFYPNFGIIIIGILILLMCVKTGITIYEMEKEKDERKE